MIKHPAVKLLVCVMLGAIPAEAATTVYTDLAAFQSALASSYQQSFTGSFQPAGNNYVGSGYSYTVEVPAGSFVYYGSSFLSGSGTGDVLTFNNFAAGTTAIGGYFYLTDFGDNFVPNEVVTLTLSDGFVDNYTPASSAEFRGYISDSAAYSSLTVDGDNSDFPSSGGLTVGTAVPEVASSGLFAAAAILTGLRRRRA